MSALIETSAASPAAQPAPRGVQWIDLKEAAKRSGRTEGHLSRQCRAEWGAAGLAELRTPSGGGKAAWHVREDADASFARVRFPEQISAEAIAAKAKLTRAQRDQITQRKQILDQWADRLKAGQVLGLSRNKVTASFLDNLLVQEDLRLSRATLYNWHTAYRSRGELGLLDGRSAAAAESAVEQRDDPFLEFVQRLFLNPRKLRLSDCLRAAEGMAAEQGWEVRSYKACQRHVNSLPRQLVVKLREGESAFVAKCEPYIERDYTSIDSNDIWCADDHRFDVMIKHEGRFIRPILTGFEDLRSRMIVGWKIIPHDANAADGARGVRVGRPRARPAARCTSTTASTTTAATCRASRSNSVAAASSPVASAARSTILSIPLTHAWPYHGQSKPIERAFRTVCDRFSKLWDTYCGNSPGERPEDLQRHLDTGKAPTLAEFTAAFSEWLADSYHGVKHLGDGWTARPRRPRTPRTSFASGRSIRPCSPSPVCRPSGRSKSRGMASRSRACASARSTPMSRSCSSARRTSTWIALRPRAPQFERSRPTTRDEDIDVFAAVSAAMRNQQVSHESRRTHELAGQTDHRRADRSRARDRSDTDVLDGKDAASITEEEARLVIQQVELYVKAAGSSRARTSPARSASRRA
jgi:hypothetical protein